MDDCIFCKIVSGELPSHKIYEDSDILVFLDINPVNPGHTMVIPKKHYNDLLDIPTELAAKCVEVTKKVAPAVMKAADVDAFHFDINNGAGAGQIIFHTHFHIQPRSKEDGLKLWLGTPTDQDKLAKMAESIKNEI
tara:strand:+ start:39 stop:446 length:408 start_codon:yes stop_codon:yes gene_type:complete